MDPENKSGPGGRDPQDGAAKRTPNTDMQADDAGTADSGQDEGSGTEAESAMKQTSKTDAETGGRH